MDELPTRLVTKASHVQIEDKIPRRAKFCMDTHMKRSAIYFALAASLGVNALFVLGQLDMAKTADNMISQHLHQTASLRTGLAAMQLHFQGRPELEAIEFLESAGAIHFVKADSIETDGFVFYVEDERIKSVGPLGW